MKEKKCGKRVRWHHNRSNYSIKIIVNCFAFIIIKIIKKTISMTAIKRQELQRPKSDRYATRTLNMPIVDVY
jgi:hypothetical protein